MTRDIEELGRRSRHALGPVVRRHDALGPRERRRRRRRRLRLRPRERRARRGPRVRARRDQPRALGASGPTARRCGSPTAAATVSSPTTSRAASASRSATFALADRNRDARGIWSGDETMWVLDGGKDSLFAYDLATGDLLGEYELVSANGDSHGLWSDGHDRLGLRPRRQAPLRLPPARKAGSARGRGRGTTGRSSASVTRSSRC